MSQVCVQQFVYGRWDLLTYGTLAQCLAFEARHAGRFGQTRLAVSTTAGVWAEMVYFVQVAGADGERCHSWTPHVRHALALARRIREDGRQARVLAGPFRAAPRDGLPVGCWQPDKTELELLCAAVA